MRRLGWLALAAVAAGAAASPSLDVPFFRQQRNGCGAAAVAMVMHYWASQAPARPLEVPSAEETYRKLYDAGSQGIRLADMRRYLEGHGFQAFTLRGQWADIENHLARGRPLIVALKPGRAKATHFAVVVGVERDNTWLNDPTKKKVRRLKRTEFEKQWDLAGRWLLLSTPATE
jgi:ABC-type bacteriocin/lantibiotic exporter with double-glycine peptidase domain